MFNQALGLESKLVYSETEIPANAAVINYSPAKKEGCLNIQPHGILNEFGIKDYSIEVNNNPRFFKLFFKNSGDVIPFDLLGAAFWLLTRYEEYIPHKTDQLNRFHYKTSLAYQYEFLHLPLVNLWISELEKILKQQFPALEPTTRKYNFVSTIDIDNVFKYRYKGFVRTVAGYTSDLLARNFLGIKQRTAIIFKRTPDPFDCYDFLITTNRELGIKAVYFLLLGDYGVNDKNHSANDLRFQALIKHLADYSKVGIHPSFGSNNNLQQLKVEISRLANILHRPVSLSRQHFSMLLFPETYQALLQGGVDEDYSMGYTNINGFRASYCYPYKWYNLDEEQETTLVINPFALSENTVNYFARKHNKTFIELAEPFINETKKYNGQLISIFHNDTFETVMKENYKNFLDKAKA